MARDICILDTSILCELVEVPHLCHAAEEVLEQLKQKIRGNETLLLPLTAILETGNHIGQNGSSHQRRDAAQRLVKMVQDAVGGRAPFVPIQTLDGEVVARWLQEFPQWVQRNDARGKGSGLGDLTLKQDWEAQRQLNPRSRVYIWSLDRQLQGYDSGAPRFR